MIPFGGTLKMKVPDYKRDPKRDHNFDHHPHVLEASPEGMASPLQTEKCKTTGSVGSEVHKHVNIGASYSPPPPRISPASRW